MLFPKSRLRFTKTYKGKTDPEGWLTLELTAQDLEGVSKIYIPFADVVAVQKQGDAAADKLKQARSLLSADWGASEEEEGV